MIHVPILLIIIPLSAPPLLFFASRISRHAVIPVAGLIGAATAVCATAAVATAVRGGIMVYRVGGWPADLGIVLAVDMLTAVMLVLAQLVFLPALLFPGQGESVVRRCTLMFLLLAGVHGMILTADLFNLYVFLEITAIVSYALLTFGTNESRLEGGFKYLLMNSLGSLCILWGIALTYSATGALSLAYLAGVFPEAPEALRNTILALMVSGFAIKFGAVPFHGWKPDAYGAATGPVAAVSSGLVAKAPLYALMRILSLLYGFDTLAGTPVMVLLAISGTASVLVGHTMALRQPRLNRLLAFSSVAHIGYIMIGIAAAGAMGLQGALFHMVNHGVIKAGMFLVSAAIALHLQTDEIKRMIEISRPLFFPALPFALLALGMIGIPPVAGFLSKWVIVLGGSAAGYVVPAASIALGGFIALWYYQRVTLTFCTLVHDIPFPRVFFTWPERLPSILLTTVSIVLLLAAPWVHPVLAAAAEALLDTGPYVTAVMMGVMP